MMALERGFHVVIDKPMTFFTGRSRQANCRVETLQVGGTIPKLRARPDALITDFPTTYDGVREMQFMEIMVESGRNNNTKWHKWIG